MVVVLMKETINNLKRVYRYGRQYKKNLIIFSIMSITFIVINIVAPIISAKALVYLTDNLYYQLFLAAVVIFLIELVAAINHWILRRNTQVFFRGTTKKIQLASAKEILKLELTDINKSSSGTFIQRIGSDTDEMSKIFTRGMGFLTNILTDIGIFIAILVIDRVVFLFYLISSLILTLIHLYKVKMLIKKIDYIEIKEKKLVV